MEAVAYMVPVLSLVLLIVVLTLFGGPLLSQSMNHMFFPEANHMLDSLYLHAPPIDKMNNIGWMALKLSSTCTYIFRVGVHRPDICNTMVHCCNLVGSTP